MDHRSFLADIPDMARGAHFSLMLLAERYNGRIPNDPNMIAKFCGITKHRWSNKVYPALQHLWAIDDGAISWEYWSEIIEHCDAKRRKLRENSRLGGEATAAKAMAEKAKPAKAEVKKNENKTTKKQQEQLSLVDDQTHKIQQINNTHKPHKEMVDIWNSAMKGTRISTVTQISEKRITSLKRTFDGKIIKKDMDNWRKLCLFIKSNEFLSGRGKGPRQWSCSIDWVCNPNNLTKMVDGNYGAKFDPTVSENQSQGHDNRAQQQEGSIRTIIYKHIEKKNIDAVGNSITEAHMRKAAQL